MQKAKKSSKQYQNALDLHAEDAKKPDAHFIVPSASWERRIYVKIVFI